MRKAPIMEEYLQAKAFRPTITVRDDWPEQRSWWWPWIVCTAVNLGGLALAMWAWVF